MGFFSDLKEDLSQAVTELLPEDEIKKGMSAEEKIQETKIPDLEAMLEKVTEEDTAVSAKAPVSAKVQPVVPEQHVKPAHHMVDTMKAAIDETAVITVGMVINGDVTSEGSIDLSGGVVGNINVLGKLNVTGTIQGNSKATEIFADNARITGEVVSEGSVKIGQSSVIVGNISAMSAVIAGAVKGDIDVHGPVILDASAIVMGNIKSKSVQINNGAVIEGMCSQCYAEVSPTTFFDDLKKTGKKN